MSLLVDVAPQSVEIDGAEFEINSDFRTAILFEQMMFDGGFPEHVKSEQALKLFYPEIPENVDGALQKILWFYAGGKEKVGRSESGDSLVRCYDFEYDDEYIFAAFWQQYGLDLESTDYLHWWKFRALFRSLSDDCEIVKIMGYRSIKITSGMSAHERQFYGKMKKLYALPVSQSEIEKIAEIEKMLMSVSTPALCENCPKVGE